MARRKLDDVGPKNAVESGSVPPPPPRPRAFGGVPKGWQSADKVLDTVTAVPTRFIGFNRASRVGGLPVRRIHTVHGPTHQGKSAFVGGLVESFVTPGDIGAYIDAEHSTPNEWFAELFKRPLSEVDNFFAERPRSYEETITKVDALLAWMRGVRAAEEKAGRRPPNSIIAVDSINKLVPEREMEQLKKMGGDAIDKAWGRLRAAMNQSWLDHLTPLLGDANCALVLVAQERKEDDELGWDPSRAVQIKGGGALTFDASLVIRVSKGAPVREDDSDNASPIVGFKHRIRIWKNKVGHLDGRYTDCFFHLSNGKLTPPGFDVARDLVEVGKDLDVVKVSGSWLSWGKKRWQGTKRAVLAISADAGLQTELFAAVNAAIAKERAQ